MSTLSELENKLLELASINESDIKNEINTDELNEFKTYFKKTKFIKKSELINMHKKVFHIDDTKEAKNCLTINYNNINIELIKNFISKIIEVYKIDYIIATDNFHNNGLYHTISNIFGLKTILLDSTNGLLKYNSKEKINYDSNFMLWFNNLSFDNNLLNIIDPILKRGINIPCIAAFFDSNNYQYELLEYLFGEGNTYTLLKLSDLLNTYVDNEIISEFAMEKLDFYNHLKSEGARDFEKYLVSLKENSYNHIKDPLKFYVEHNLSYHRYYTKNLDYNNICIFFLESIEWNKFIDYLKKNGKHIGFIVIDIEKINNFDKDELGYILNKEGLNIKVFDHNPNKYSLITNLMNNELCNNYFNITNTELDGFVLNLNNNNLNTTEELDNIRSLFSKIKSKILLNITFDKHTNIFNFFNLFYNICNLSNTQVLQGIMFNFDNIKTYSKFHKLFVIYKITSLIPSFLYIKTYNKEIYTFFKKNNFDYLAYGFNDIILKEDVIKTIVDTKRFLIPDIKLCLKEKINKDDRNFIIKSVKSNKTILYNESYKPKTDTNSENINNNKTKDNGSISQVNNSNEKLINSNTTESNELVNTNNNQNLKRGDEATTNEISLLKEQLLKQQEMIDKILSSKLS